MGQFHTASPDAQLGMLLESMGARPNSIYLRTQTMKQVTAYQTEDGKTFYNKTEAAEHELRLEVEKLVDKFFYSGCRPDDIANGIVENAFYFNRLLGEAMKYIPIPAEEDDS